MTAPAADDREVRRFVYRYFVEQGRPPTVAETAEAIGIPEAEAAASYRRLEDARVFVLAPGTVDIWMANPLSAVPTPFSVQTDRGRWWGTCVWDAFGIPAMLGEDATISTACADCSEPMELRIRDRSLESSSGVAHFAVPAARWWDNIGYT